MDRCALFVDAGYMLADGAMAVHGTRRGESVSWDYEGLLQLLSSLARERSGVPVLRCYWYEATVDGRRTAEHDALADVPGIKLRMAKIRPGRREGVETEIHRDLTTLARNNAISDALVISAEEDLAQVVADVQDLGIRVTLVHIAVDGNWTISRALRQESDDIMEIGVEHLRPYVELIAGAEPAHADEQGEVPERGIADQAPARSLANGHSVGTGSYQQLPGPANHAPPAIYTAPVVAEYQRPAPQLPRASSREPRETRESREPVQDRSREERAVANGEAQAQVPQAAAPSGVSGVSGGRPDIYPAPAASTRVPRERQEPGPAARPRGAEESSGYPGGPQELTSGAAAQPEAAAAPGGQLRRLPARPSSTPGAAQGSAPGQHGGQSQAAGGAARSAPYSGPQPAATSAAPGGYQSVGGVSLAEAVQAAHEEGQEFGGSVARDAPALWLEAVLARKPRMPSDLEARLLQGSALPIDFLLHDEVRHALRRGFWDALERTRR